jgi:hypothetical protein
MQQTPASRSPLRLTLLIISLLGLILTSIFLSRRSVDQIHDTSASIYEDRLVPAALITSLTSKTYQKRLLLESHVLGEAGPDTNRTGFVPALDRLNRQIDSLLAEYDKTILTPREAELLALLKQRLMVYNQLEEEMTTRSGNRPQAQQDMFAGASLTTFRQVSQTLTELSTLQLTVGERLLHQSRGQTNYIYVLTALQIGLVLVVGFSLFWQRN